MASKLIIHKFQQPIYPMNIWIVITNSQVGITNRFWNNKGEELSDSPDNCDAMVVDVVDKETKERGDIIIFRKKEYMTVATMSHEAFHCADNIMSKLGLQCYDEGNNEHIAYLIGYITDCCDQVRTNKFK